MDVVPHIRQEEGDATFVATVPDAPYEWTRDRIDDLSDFKGRLITVYYTPRERKEGDARVKYNEVWRIKVFSSKKK